MAKSDLLRVLYVGDVMAKPGREVVKSLLPGIIKKYKPDLTIAQGENVTHGKGISPMHMRELQECGVQFFSGGNHTVERPAIRAMLDNPSEPIVAPINQHGIEPEWGAKDIETKHGLVQVVSLLGTVFPRLDAPMKNPLRVIDDLLDGTPGPYAARIVNFHADWSSEKRVIGYYLDGRVSAVIGDHWHVPTADALVLPGGTAHITDVGMVGTLHSSLGVDVSSIVGRWRDEARNKNEIAEGGPYQFNAVLVEVDPQTGLAHSIEAIQRVIDKL